MAFCPLAITLYLFCDDLVVLITDNEDIVKAVVCAGLYPNVARVKNATHSKCKRKSGRTNDISFRYVINN